jgi:hypothetical protein
LIAHRSGVGDIGRVLQLARTCWSGNASVNARQTLSGGVFGNLSRLELIPNGRKLHKVPAALLKDGPGDFFTSTKSAPQPHSSPCRIWMPPGTKTLWSRYIE